MIKKQDLQIIIKIQDACIRLLTDRLSPLIFAYSVALSDIDIEKEISPNIQDIVQDLYKEFEPDDLYFFDNDLDIHDYYNKIIPDELLKNRITHYIKNIAPLLALEPYFGRNRYWDTDNFFLEHIDQFSKNYLAGLLDNNALLASLKEQYGYWHGEISEETDLVVLYVMQRLELIPFLYDNELQRQEEAKKEVTNLLGYISSMQKK